MASSNDTYLNRPPVRQAPDDETHDNRRIEWSFLNWTAQDDRLRQYHWQVEENVRMLAGNQWSYFHPLLNRWIDIQEFANDRDLLWRQKPVLNHLFMWFMLSHARATENPPIITFLPGPDRIDAQLAETMDSLFKILWRQVNMPDMLDLQLAWMISCGRSHGQSYIDQDAGDLRAWIGRGPLPLLGPDGVMLDQNTGEPQMTEDEYDDVPFGREGKPYNTDAEGVIQPLAGFNQESGEREQFGDAHQQREGRIKWKVLSPLNVRGSWGALIPWYEKRCHYVRSYYSPEEVYDKWGLDLTPEIRGHDARDVGELERMLYGTGFFNASSSSPSAQTTTGWTEGYIEVLETWEAPSRMPGYERTEESPGGRYMAVTRKTVLTDGARPANFEHTSPIRTFEFVRIPGRPSASTPQEIMNPVQRGFNRAFAGIGEYIALCTQPKPIIDRLSGITANQWTNEPGKGFIATRRPSVPAVEWMVPPNLPTDVWRILGEFRQELDFMGSFSGAGGEPPSVDPSGELVKELRFNSDRVFGPTARRNVEEVARIASDWIRMMPLVFSQEKLLTYTGDDNVVRTIAVMPHLFTEGSVNVQADGESMLPEGRGERTARIWRMWKDGALGTPIDDPAVLRRFHEMVRFPHMSRTAQPYGVHGVMAQQIAGALARGQKASDIQFFPWYDLDVHLAILTETMAAPEFLSMKPEVQAEFVEHWKALSQQQAERQAAQQQAEIEQAILLQSIQAGGGKPNGGPPQKNGKGASPGKEPPSGGIPKDRLQMSPTPP